MVQLSRRGALVAGAVAAAGAGVAGWRVWGEVTGPDLHVPDVPAGEHGVSTMSSVARGRDVDLFTAVPDGYGDGAGLPVCLVLHGSTARPEDYADLGFPQLLTAAVRGGAPPFVLAGADGGSQRWEPVGEDDPGRMVSEEMPAWLRERGFAVDRPALWGWSMGGYGALRLAQERPDRVSAVAAFSPAVSDGDRVFTDAAELRDTPVGLWCGTDDPLYPTVERLAEVLPDPDVVAFAPGRHDMEYWTRVAEDAFAFLGGQLAGRAQ